MSETDLDWDDLRVLGAVVAAGSLSKAADELELAQPTVGRRLDRLEEALGVPVVRRTSQGCSPTEAGKTLLPLVRRMEAAAGEVSQFARLVSHQLSGTVRVAVSELTAHLLLPHLADILSEAPGLRLELVAGLGFVSLERGEADLAFRSRPPEGDAWVVQALETVRFAIYGAETYVAQHPEALDPEQRWQACRWITFSESQGSRSSQFVRERLSRPADLMFSSSLLILESVRRGLGLGVFPTQVGDREPGLVRVSEALEGIGFPAYLVMHPSARREPRVRWVARRLTEVLRVAAATGGARGA